MSHSREQLSLCVCVCVHTYVQGKSLCPVTVCGLCMCLLEKCYYKCDIYGQSWSHTSLLYSVTLS